MKKYKYMELIILLIFIIGGIVPLIKPFYIIDKFPNLSVQIYISFIYWVVNKLHRFIWKRDTLIIPHIYFVAMCVALYYATHWHEYVFFIVCIYLFTDHMSKLK